MFFYDDRTPECLGDDDGLAPDEHVVGVAYAQLIALLGRLHDAPFARQLYRELQDYLDGPAWEAADAFERLMELGPSALTERLRELEPDALDADDERVE